jgi:hypothetical protein
MLFAAHAQASSGAGGALALAEKAAQLPTQAAHLVEAQTASPPAGEIAGAVSASTGPTASAGGSSPEASGSGAGSEAAPSGGATVVVEEGEPAGPPPSQEVPAQTPAQAPATHPAGVAVDAAASQPRLTSAGATATAASARQTGVAQRSADASTASSAVDRGREAEAVAGLWPSSPSAHGPQALSLAPDFQRLIAQFQSLARDISASSAASVPAKLVGAAAQELAQLIAAGAPSLNASGRRVLSLLARPAGELGAPGSGPELSALERPGARLQDARRALQKTSAVTSRATSPAVGGLLPSAAGAALGSGMAGAAAPAVALLVAAAMCLLGTWLRQRLADDGLACRSALLNMRLERPG